MKKMFIVVIALIVVSIAAYFFLRLHVLKSRDFPANTSKARAPADLRPQLIAKLQQMVKDGSDGLYKLSVERINIELAPAGVSMSHVSLIPDTAVLKQRSRNRNLPSAVVSITLDSLHIDGISIEDILQKEKIDLGAVALISPVINIFKKQGNKDTATLYERLSGQTKSIAIDDILVTHATIIIHGSDNKANTIQDAGLHLEHVLIDSATQTDNKLLFADKASMSIKNFSRATKEDLYLIKIGSIDLAAPANTISFRKLSVHSRLNEREFEEKLTVRKDFYHLDIQSISLSGINWEALMNDNAFIAKEGTIDKGTFSVFLDRSLPFANVRKDNFPQQQLMRLPDHIYVPKISIRHSNLVYSEYNPAMEKKGTIYIDNINGSVLNVTNMSGQVKKNKMMVMQASGLFMHRIALRNTFRFDLSKFKTGDFSLDLDIGTMDSSILNPITVPLSEFMFKRGVIDKGTVHVEGNNTKASGHGVLLYHDLHLTPVKEDKEEAKVRKKALLSFIANTLLIKNNNPSKNEPPRSADASSDRNIHQSFFSQVWKTIFIGILKIIGLPEKLSEKTY